MTLGQALWLVEDDETSREVLTLLLAAEGWAVTAFATGEEALAACPPVSEEDGAAPAVVLCDLHLPGRCGFALADALRAALPAAALPAAALLAMSATLREGSGRGYDGVLQKPFAASAVRLALDQATKTAASAEEPEAVQEGALDGETVAALQRQMGARAGELFRFALDDAEARLERMAAAAEAGDRQGYQREAHALKGSAGMIGARRLAAMAGAAEDAAMSTARTTVFATAESMRNLHRACDELRRMLETSFSA